VQDAVKKVISRKIDLWA